jgi:hypothetical protein
MTPKRPQEFFGYSRGGCLKGDKTMTDTKQEAEALIREIILDSGSILAELLAAHGRPPGEIDQTLRFYGNAAARVVAPKGGDA